VMLGSCVALGLKAAPWPHNWAERVQA
jgi:hypothetical protein